MSEHIRSARSTGEPTIGSANAVRARASKGGMSVGIASKAWPKHVIGAAHAAAGVFQQIHHTQVRHRIDPKDAHSIGFQDADAGRDAPPNLSSNSANTSSVFTLIGTKMDRKHFGHEHFERRHGTRAARENRLPQIGQPATHLVGSRDAGRKLFVGQPLSGVVSSRLPNPFEFRFQPTQLVRLAPEIHRASRRPLRPDRGDGDAHFPPKDRKTERFQALRDRRKIVARRPTLHVSRPGIGKRSPRTNAPSIARTGQNESSMPKESAGFEQLASPSKRHGNHHAPSG